MKTNSLVVTAFATTTALLVPLAVSLQPSSAAETTIGLCETTTNTARIYNQDGQLKMRVFDRVRNVTWMDTPATRTTNPEVVEYRNLRGETTVTASFNRNSPTNCSIRVGSKLESGRVLQAGTTSSTTKTIGVCETTSNVSKIYDQSRQLKMQVTDRGKNRVWMDTAAVRTVNPEVVEYRNKAGSNVVTTSFYRKSSTNCFVMVGNKLEKGRVTQGQAGTS